MTTATMPARSQYMKALERGNQIRHARANIKTGLRTQTKTVAEVLTHPAVAKMEVRDLLMCLPRVGRIRAHKLLAQVPVMPTKMCGTMTERQRQALVEALRK